MLKYTKRYLPLHIIQSMYYCIVDSHLRYCRSVWGCAGDSIIKNCKSCKNQVARVVTNSPNYQTSVPLISQLGWLTVKEMIDFEMACTVYKALKGLTLRWPYMRSMLHSRSESCNKTLRNTSTEVRIPLCKTSIGQRSLPIEESLFGIS